MAAAAYGTARVAGASEKTSESAAPAETPADRAFLAEVKTPAEHIDKTLRGFGTGTRVETLETDIHAFRYHGSVETARGRWVTEEPVNSPIRELALNRKDNPATHMTEWVVPAGTKVIRGPVGPLFGQPGGGSQIFIPDPSVLREP